MALFVRAPAAKTILRQRVLEERPYTNCMLISELNAQRWGAVSSTDYRTAIARLRNATGIPEVNNSGQTLGLRFSDVQRAVAAMQPWMVYEYGPWKEAELLKALAANEIVA